jgi:hypothetical protein
MVTAAWPNSAGRKAEFKIKIVIKIGDRKKIFIPAHNLHVSAVPVSEPRPANSGNLEKL